MMPAASEWLTRLSHVKVFSQLDEKPEQQEIADVSISYRKLLRGWGEQGPSKKGTSREGKG